MGWRKNVCLEMRDGAVALFEADLHRHCAGGLDRFGECARGERGRAKSRVSGGLIFGAIKNYPLGSFTFTTLVLTNP